MLGCASPKILATSPASTKSSMSTFRPMVANVAADYGFEALVCGRRPLRRVATC